MTFGIRQLMTFGIRQWYCWDWELGTATGTLVPVLVKLRYWTLLFGINSKKSMGEQNVKND
jgi:hypothetical protein